MNEECVRDSDKITPCDALGKALDGSYHSGRKGVTSLETVNDTSFIIAGFVLRSGGYVKKGIKLNYCPFCGNRI
ncbi:hypothetical protein [Geovibrio ferrireducens]|uniref:hypothetical protein n=1 Tax=Geovibrio ferrireducens TaxID=46201 RepID=UPI00224660EA|nr:hypothetical protein [Geovibrio ferrireducens]